MLPESFLPLPDTARLWLLAMDAQPSPEAQTRLGEEMEAILAQWRHKGHAYRGAWALLQGRIIAVAEPDLAANPSGCAIDGMLRKVHRLAADLGLGIVDPASHILASGPEGLRAVAKADLEGQLLAGALGQDTPILDLALYNLGDLRAGRLEAPLARTWIGRKFRVA